MSKTTKNNSFLILKIILATIGMAAAVKLVVVFFSLLLGFLFVDRDKELKVVNVPSIESEQQLSGFDNYINAIQSGLVNGTVTLQLYSYGGDMYCSCNDFDEGLCTYKISSDGFEKIFEGEALNQIDNRLYYCCYDSAQASDKYYYYDFEKGVSRFIGEDPFLSSGFEIFVDDLHTTYLWDGSKVIKYSENEFEVLENYGEIEVVINGKHLKLYEVHEKAYCDADSETIAELGIGTVIPYKNGVLCRREFAYEGESVLSAVDLNGKEIDLLISNCYLTLSCMTVHDNKAYISIKRYERGGFFGRKNIKHDVISGTYIVDLNDYSIHKVNNVVFENLYIFDDTGIYAVDTDDNMYKLTFDGAVERKILYFD